MNNSKKIILDLCGGTGAWSKPYASAGYDVRIITLPKHDVRLYIPPANVYGILAAPPCCHLAGSGARWWRIKGEEKLLDALGIVDACLRIIHVCKPRFWALENPVGRLVRWLGRPVLYFRPYEFGDPRQKKTCLGGIFSEPRRCLFYELLGQIIWRMPPSPERKAKRSITPPGFAQAFFEANP